MVDEGCYDYIAFFFFPKEDLHMKKYKPNKVRIVNKLLGLGFITIGIAFTVASHDITFLILAVVLGVSLFFCKTKMY